MVVGMACAGSCKLSSHLHCVTQLFSALCPEQPIVRELGRGDEECPKRCVMVDIHVPRRLRGFAEGEKCVHKAAKAFGNGGGDNSVGSVGILMMIMVDVVFAISGSIPSLASVSQSRSCQIPPR